jgi:simple sugar transport system permease protein
MNILAKFDPFGRFLLFTIVLIFVVVGFMSGGIFVDSYNLQSMGFQMPEIALLSVAMMLAMMSGNSGIDLSLIGIANLSGIVAGIVAAYAAGDQSPFLFTVIFIASALVTGMACGLVNGLLIAVVGYTPILATLGTQLVFLGIAVALTDGAAILFKYSNEFSWVGNSLIFGMPVSLAMFAVIVVGIGLLLSSTAFGKRLILMGTNPVASRYVGINNPRITMTVYFLCGLLAAMAGVLMSSRSSSVKWDYGNSYILIAILTVVMAGVSPMGGRGRIGNVVLASIALQLLSSAFSILGMSSFLKDFTWGALLILSIMATQALTLSEFLALISRRDTLTAQVKPVTQAKKGGA